LSKSSVGLLLCLGNRTIDSIKINKIYIKFLVVIKETQPCKSPVRLSVCLGNRTIDSIKINKIYIKFLVVIKETQPSKSSVANLLTFRAV
jgi:hypothetical protein